MVILNEHSAPPPNSPVYDFLYRPEELEDVCMWDQISLYEKVRISKQKIALADSDDEDEEAQPRSNEQNFLRFQFDHPQSTTYCLKKRKLPHIPVLSGTPIPRSDLPKDAIRYAVVMLALFSPWRRTKVHPLKAEEISWKDALQQFLLTLSQDKLDIIGHMQEQWECRHAADDFSAQYKARMASFNAASSFSRYDDHEDDALTTLVNDLDWRLGQLDEPTGAEYAEDDVVDPGDDLGGYEETCSDAKKRHTEAIIALAQASNFYHVPTPPDNIQELLKGKAVLLTNKARASEVGKLATLFIVREQAAAIQARSSQSIYFFSRNLRSS
ncbi:hypothetical protein GGX14DRAFT_405419 [Mycena pura]|uniref:Uncharacterized protein n=1 Tax=Mycena pura TaxID=153505 RepID=A0AAD6USG6_9AGAR|nr:hypothetical protein GGX14DRAFT_405419 [Mycena pura]